MLVHDAVVHLTLVRSHLNTQVSNDGDDVGIAEVISCKFHGNKAAAYGGGAIYSSGRVSVIRSTFEGNNAGTYGAYLCLKLCFHSECL